MIYFITLLWPVFIYISLILKILSLCICTLFLTFVGPNWQIKYSILFYSILYSCCLCKVRGWIPTIYMYLPPTDMVVMYNDLICPCNLSLGHIMSYISYQSLSRSWHTDFDYGLYRLSNLEIGLMAGVTDRLGMLILLGTWSNLRCPCKPDIYCRNMMKTYQR
jgi:hypothetical protein